MTVFPALAIAYYLTLTCVFTHEFFFNEKELELAKKREVPSWFVPVVGTFLIVSSPALWPLFVAFAVVECRRENNA